MSHPTLLIDGTWRAGQGPQFIKTDPLDNQLLWRGAAANIADVTAACAAARKAFTAWAGTEFSQREQLVTRFAALLEQNKQHLASVISRETSKPYWETLTEVQAMISKVSICRN